VLVEEPLETTFLEDFGRRKNHFKEEDLLVDGQKTQK